MTKRNWRFTPIAYAETPEWNPSDPHFPFRAFASVNFSDEAAAELLEHLAWETQISRKQIATATTGASAELDRFFVSCVTSASDRFLVGVTDGKEHRTDIYYKRNDPTLSYARAAHLNAWGRRFRSIGVTAGEDTVSNWPELYGAEYVCHLRNEGFWEGWRLGEPIRFKSCVESPAVQLAAIVANAALAFAVARRGDVALNELGPLLREGYYGPCPIFPELVSKGAVIADSRWDLWSYRMNVWDWAGEEPERLNPFRKAALRVGHASNLRDRRDRLVLKMRGAGVSPGVISSMRIDEIDIVENNNLRYWCEASRKLCYFEMDGADESDFWALVRANINPSAGFLFAKVIESRPYGRRRLSVDDVEGIFHTRRFGVLRLVATHKRRDAMSTVC